jgi:hypothetical protein
MAETKIGSNFLVNTATGWHGNNKIQPYPDYNMHGFYFSPLQMRTQSKRIRAIEFSSRYEYLDNYKLNSNAVKQQSFPNLG